MKPKRKVKSKPSDTIQFDVESAARSSLQTIFESQLHMALHSKSDTAKQRAAELIVRLANVDGIQKTVDDSAQVEFTDEPGKVLHLDPVNA